jgi:hypothetical protein
MNGSSLIVGTQSSKLILSGKSIYEFNRIFKLNNINPYFKASVEREWFW